MAVRLLRYYLDTEPMVVVACGLGGIGLGSALIVPRIRNALGYDTTQYYGADAAVHVAARAKMMPSKWKKEEIGMKPERQADEE